MVKIITVNYNTPELIKKLIETYYEFKYDKYQLIIIDGSDLKNKIEEIKKLSEKYTYIIFDFIGYNIHHGPGLHYAIQKYKSEYYLLVDSDLYFKKAGYIEYCLDNINDNLYGVGRVIKYEKNVHNGMSYLHPNGCLINRKKYYEFSPLIAHGAPFINTMNDILNKGKSNIIKEINFKKYINRGGRGTVNKFGYRSNLFNNLNKKFNLK